MIRLMIRVGSINILENEGMNGKAWIQSFSKQICAG
jgi:hypothetical protein